MKLAHRIPAVVGGYLAACGAAGCTLAIVGVLASQSQRHYSIGGMLLLVVFGGVFFAMAIAGAALLPGVVIIVMAERNALCSVWFYLGIGALAGVLAYGIYVLLTVLAPGQVETFFAVDLGRMSGALAAMFSLPALAGGFVYWRLAGRVAGSKPRIRPPRGDLI
ncbi:MAG: hypothetical protein IT563_07830 [Alphaproteobacteria bacterium]|nr:hypothetical protein [Alphaproteobacteria bacterium]